ncbi:MAG TPA: hypothetical protein VFZ65_23485 [Planctomycetota bacterium]|nr:hypothetical protein [Planctomycetota bacterium]
MTPAIRPRADSGRCIAVVAAVAAAALYLALRVNMMLADDWLLLSLFDDPDTRHHLDWATILADHWTPWLFGDWGYYRPATSLLMAAWMQMFGAWPDHWNLLNVSLHALDVGMFVVLLRRLGLAPRAMVVAGAFVILHPAMVEPVLWFSSVNEVVAVAGTLIACLGVCRHRDGRRGASLWWMLGLWIAVAGKENGAVAVLVLPLLDRALGPRDWREFVRDHLWRSGPVLALAVVARTIAGCLFPPALFEGLDNSVGHLVDSLATKTGLVLLPGVGLSPYAAAGAGAAVLAAAAFAARRFAWRLLLTGALLAAYLAFGTYHFVDGSYTSSRLLYPAVFAAALLVGWLVEATSWRRAAIPLGAAIVLLFVLSARRTLQRGGDYRAAAAESGAVVESLLAAHRALPPGGLLSPVLVPETMHGVVALQSNSLFAILHSRSSGPSRLLPLTHLTSPVYVSRREQFHGLPLRIAVEARTTLLSLNSDGTATTIPAAQALGPTDPPADELRPDAQGVVRLPAPVSPLRIETVVVTAPRARAVRLRWMFGDGGTAPPGHAHRVIDGVARVQVGDDFLLLTGLAIGGVTGLRLEPEAADAVAVDLTAARVQLSPDPDRLPAPAPANARLSRASFARTIEAPATAPGTHLRMGLLLPSSGVSFEVRPSAPITLPKDVANHLDWTLRVAPEITVVYWFYEQREGEAEPALGARSAAVRLIVER